VKPGGQQVALQKHTPSPSHLTLLKQAAYRKEPVRRTAPATISGNLTAGKKKQNATLQSERGVC